MKRTPLEAFNRFLELTPDTKTAWSHRSPEFIELVDAFLANPEQHREHVHLIFEVAWAIKFCEQVRWLNPYTGPLRFLPKLNVGFSKEYLERVQRLKAGLLASAQPGEFTFDVLPSRLIETPPEWMPQSQLHLMEARVAIHPSHGLVPEKASLSLSLQNDRLKFADCFPSTEFSEVGEYEVGLTNEARFVRTASAGGSLEIGAKSPPFGVAVNIEGKGSKESSESRTYAHKFKYPAKVLKVVSSAVGKRARWEMLRTGDESPTGGLTFYATVLVPKGLLSCSIDGLLEVWLANWGAVQLPLQADLTLSAGPPTKPSGEAGA